ncbi:hypothetical protein SAMN05880558_1141, partial [Aeromonas sp. RU39B]|uniref:retention module-containing protein n=1 Tax=Aeromonas sp. RU39B TaxID=1907416 RepID=UPI0009567E12
MNIITTEQKVVITSFVGKVYVMGPDGHQIELKVGDVLPKGTAIFVEDGGSVNTAVAIEADDLAQQAGQPGATPDDVAALQQAIADGVDPTKAFDATAAGAAAAGGGVAGASSNDGYVVVDMALDQTIAIAGYDTTHEQAAAQEEIASASVDVVQIPETSNALVIATDDRYEVNEDGSVTLTLLANDKAPDGGLAIQSINGVALTGAAQSIAVTNGTVEIAADGSISFVPAANFNGEISFDYVAKDADGDTDSATVSIQVAAQDDPVDAVNDSYEVNEDGSVTLTLLANDKAPDGGLAIQSINGVALTGG